MQIGIHNGLPPLKKDILETTIQDILRTYNASMWLAGPEPSAGNFVDSLGATPLTASNGVVGYVEDILSHEDGENLCANSTWTGYSLTAVPGCIRNNSANITITFVNSGEDEYGTYLDIRWAGTTAGVTEYPNVAMQNFAIEPGCVCSVGEIFTAKARVQIIAGTWAGSSSFILINEMSAANAYLVGGVASPVISTTAQDLMLTRTTTNASVAKAAMVLQVNAIPSTAMDFTVRVWNPQFQRGNRRAYLPTSGTVIARPKNQIPAYQATTGFKPVLRGKYLSAARTSHTFADASISGALIRTFQAANDILGNKEATIIKRTGNATGLATIAPIKPSAVAMPMSVAFLIKAIVGRYVMFRVQGLYPARADIAYDFWTGVPTIFLQAGGITVTSVNMTKVSTDYYLCQVIVTLDAHNGTSLILTPRNNIDQVDAADVGPELGEFAIDSYACSYAYDNYLQPPFPIIPGSVNAYSSNTPFSWKFDGTDDRLVVAKPTINPAVNHFRIVCFRIPPVAPVANSATVSGTHAVITNVSLARILVVAGGAIVQAFWRDDAAILNAPSTVRTLNEKVVATARRDGLNLTLNLRGDLASPSSGSEAILYGSMSSNLETIGCHNPGGIPSQFFGGEIYGIISGNGAPTAGELLALENFLAGCAGFTPLP